VLIYVGAPERLFVGHATLSTGVHAWTPDEEAKRHPGDWPTGVSFSEVAVWKPPVAIDSVWSRMPSSSTNPRAQFFAGVMRIKQQDYQTVLAERSVGDQPNSSAVSVLTNPPPVAASEGLFQASEHLRRFLASPRPISEDATRAMFINRVLEALGYTEFGDVDYGVPVDSGDVADYVLSVNGKPSVVVEAKKLGSPLQQKEAAQVVKYASVLGVRRGVATDGRLLKLYDPRIPDVRPEERMVFEVDLGEYADREDFDVRIYPNLELLSKADLAGGGGLEQRTAQEAIRSILGNPESGTMKALRQELGETKLVHLTDSELTETVGSILGSGPL
jgi:hypothetical protein